MTAMAQRYDKIAWDKAAFERLITFVQNRTGIKIAPSKMVYLEGRLRNRLPHMGFDTLGHYCHWLLDENGLEEEENALIDLVTTNKTDFFRELHHFDFFFTKALPSLRAAGTGVHTPLRVWSAGCSNGSEPYSLAMLCQDFAHGTPGFKFEILASDISAKVLMEAVKAIYPHADIEPVPIPMRQRYLKRDPERNEVRITSELRRKVKFFQHNLMDLPYPPQQPVDIIFCRNLLIYFDKKTQREVLDRLCHHVKPGGYLILGHSETVTGMELPLRSIAPTTFQRTKNP